MSTPSRFTIPKVVQKQQARSFKAVFIYLYQASNEESEIELNATKASKEIGISRSQFYEAMNFLKRVRLLFPLVLRTGRGNHSLYKLNWHKPGKKCPALSNKNIKTLSLRKDSVVKQRQNFNNQWGKMLKAFRELLQKSTFLTRQEVQLCCGVLGRYLRGKPIELCRSIYQGLSERAVCWRLEPPNWVLEVRQLCAWFMGIVKRLSASNPAFTRAKVSKALNLISL